MMCQPKKSSSHLFARIAFRYAGGAAGRELGTMIDDPPLVRLRRRVPRPTAEQLGALWGTPTGYIADALHGRASLGREVKPVVPEQAAFCGTAVTIHAGPADNLAVFAALPLIQASDVLVVCAWQLACQVG